MKSFYSICWITLAILSIISQQSFLLVQGQKFNRFKSYKDAKTKPRHYATKIDTDHAIGEYLTSAQKHMMQKRHGPDTADVSFDNNWSGFKEAFDGKRATVNVNAMTGRSNFDRKRRLKQMKASQKEKESEKLQKHSWFGSLMSFLPSCFSKSSFLHFNHPPASENDLVLSPEEKKNLRHRERIAQKGEEMKENFLTKSPFFAFIYSSTFILSENTLHQASDDNGDYYNDGDDDDQFFVDDESLPLLGDETDITDVVDISDAIIDDDGDDGISFVTSLLSFFKQSDKLPVVVEEEDVIDQSENNAVANDVPEENTFNIEPCIFSRSENQEEDTAVKELANSVLDYLDNKATDSNQVNNNNYKQGSFIPDPQQVPKNFMNREVLKEKKYDIPSLLADLFNIFGKPSSTTSNLRGSPSQPFSQTELDSLKVVNI